MPLYDFRCTKCSHVQTGMMSIARMESGETVTCSECGSESKKAFTVTNFGMSSPEALGRHKAPADFRNFLSQVKKAHPGSSIKDH